MLLGNGFSNTVVFGTFNNVLITGGLSHFWGDLKVGFYGNIKNTTSLHVTKHVYSFYLTADCFKVEIYFNDIDILTNLKLIYFVF